MLVEKCKLSFYGILYSLDLMLYQLGLLILFTSRIGLLAYYDLK